MSSIDPSLQVLEFHPFGTPQISDNYILPSMLGYVVVGETYPGSFNDRSIWADMLQEIICITLQVILTCILIVITLRYLFVKKPNILF